MILNLSIHDLALIASLNMEFQRGLHVMTGETGAGKSIVVDAVNLVLGGRADRDLIRTGKEKAWVEATFDISDNPQAQEMLNKQELEAEGHVLTLYREISRSGRNLCRVCGVTMPVSFLKELAALLMDVHGQHEHQFLMDPTMHLAFLDRAGDEHHEQLLSQVADAQSAFLVNHRQYAHLVRENEQKHYRMNELKQSLEELKKAGLKPGEEVALTQERDRFRHAEKIIAAVQTAYGAVAAGEDNASLLTRLKTATDALRGLTELGEPYASLASRCEATYYELQEIGYDLAGMAESSDFDPHRAEQVENRLDLIHRLERKYGDTVEAVLHRQEEMQEEFDRFSSMDQQVAEMGREHKRLLAEYRALARQLTASRHELAAVFEKRMMQQLQDLGMEKTRFSVAFLEREKQLMPQPNGDDQVEFMISPNPGEPLKPLAKIASGGELSRLMLAIKSLEAEKGGVGCMVFDEIDTGISGRMAQVVAEKMAAIARSRQVICVTHLPQIAAMADHQFLVEKSVADGRTSTNVRMLSHEERINEVARMLGGGTETLDSAKSHAATMLDNGEKIKHNM